MATKNRLVPTAIVYEIGVDVTQELWNELILRVGDWYTEWRPDLKEPNIHARQVLDACLKGVKPSEPSQVWNGAQTASFATRVRMACRFDIDKMAPIRNANEQTRIKKSREVEKKKKALAAKMDDPMVPDAIRKDIAKTAKYGDDPRVFLSSEEHKRWEGLKKAYVAQFPELESINAEAELNGLLDLLIIADRHRTKLLQGLQVDATDQKALTDQIVNFKKALGIHPEQLAKRVQQETGGTIGEVATRMGSLPKIAALRKQLFAQEAVLMYQMYHTPSPRTDLGGYQHSDVSLFAVTRCMTCACASCGTRNFKGLKVEEIEQYLVSEGRLAESSVPDPVEARDRQDDDEVPEESDATAS